MRKAKKQIKRPAKKRREKASDGLGLAIQAAGVGWQIVKFQLGPEIANSERGQFLARDINNLIRDAKSGRFAPNQVWDYERLKLEEQQSRELLDGVLGDQSSSTPEAIRELLNRAAIPPRKLIVWGDTVRWFYGPDSDGSPIGGPFETEIVAHEAASARGQYEIYLYDLKLRGILR